MNDTEYQEEIKNTNVSKRPYSGSFIIPDYKPIKWINPWDTIERRNLEEKIFGRKWYQFWR
jgi:hypothetical protein